MQAYKKYALYISFADICTVDNYCKHSISFAGLTEGEKNNNPKLTWNFPSKFYLFCRKFQKGVCPNGKVEMNEQCDDDNYYKC